MLGLPLVKIERRKNVRTGKRILVIDEDLMVVLSLREHLETEGYEVVCGYDGLMAIRLASTCAPDLIILDMFMFALNGIKAIDNIRRQTGMQDTPIIVLNGEPSKRAYSTVVDLPHVVHVKKPLDLKNLSSLIREMLKP